MKVIILAHFAVLPLAEFARERWQSAGFSSVTIDLPTPEENRHAGPRIAGRFLRILRENLGEDLLIAEYDALYLRGEITAEPGVLKCCLWHAEPDATHLYSALTPWVIAADIAQKLVDCAHATTRPAPRTELQKPVKDGLLDRWIGSECQRIGIPMLCEAFFAHPPHLLQEAAQEPSIKVVHPVKTLQLAKELLGL